MEKYNEGNFGAASWANILGRVSSEIATSLKKKKSLLERCSDRVQQWHLKVKANQPIKKIFFYGYEIEICDNLMKYFSK